MKDEANFSQNIRESTLYTYCVRQRIVKRSRKTFPGVSAGVQTTELTGRTANHLKLLRLCWSSAKQLQVLS